jgi:hypothetical protein
MTIKEDVKLTMDSIVKDTIQKGYNYFSINDVPFDIFEPFDSKWGTRTYYPSYEGNLVKIYCDKNNIKITTWKYLTIDQCKGKNVNGNTTLYLLN